MRFEELQIPAFGPFTDFSLTLPEKKYDIHLIYGANEAGKSSLLRAMRHLLYGIPVRTTDSFQHQNAQLRIGAKISGDGESLAFFRKKGNRNTLLDEDGNVLKENVLAPFLGPVDESFFQNMFGLDTESLRSGARQLLSGEGDLGSAIFSASRGGAPINEAIQSLEAEAHELFKDRSRNTKIAIGLRELKEAEAAANEETISTHRWGAFKKAIKKAGDDFEERDGARREHLARRDFVARCHQAMPVMQRARRLEGELVEITLPELSSDFAKRVRETEIALASAKQALALHAGRRESLKAALAKISDPSAVLNRSADLDQLHRRQAQFEADLKAIAELRSEIASLEAILGEEMILSDYPAIDSRTLDRLKKGAEILNEFDVRSGQLAVELKNLEGRQKKSREALGSLEASSELESLRELVEAADQFAPKKEQVPADLEACASLVKRIAILRERLRVEGDPRKLRVASRGTIEQEERVRVGLQEEIRDLEKLLSQCRDGISREQAALDHLGTQAVLFSPANLKEARDLRDAIWEEVRGTGEVDEALTPAIGKADEVADALNRDAEAIAEASGHQARLTEALARQKDLKSDLESLRESLLAWMEVWEEAHARFAGQLPVALLAWREEWLELCEFAGELEEVEGRLKRVEDEEEAILKKLGGEDFARSHRKVRTMLEKATRKHGERDAIRKQLASDELKHEQLSEEAELLSARIEAAMTQWEGLCESVGVFASQAPNAVLREVEVKLVTRANLLRRIDLKGELEAKEEFVSTHQALLEDCALALKTSPSEPVLFALSEEAKEKQNRRETLGAQLSELDQEEPGLKLELAQRVENLAKLRSQAACDDLEAAITQFEKREGLREALGAQNELLEGFARGVELSEFLADLERQDVVALTEEDAGLEESEAALQGERDRAKEDLDELRREERGLRSASDLAAHHRQRAAGIRSALAADFTRFRQLHHAIDFLKRQVESYREQAQGPMMEKTSRFFRSLTGEVFDRVVARPDDKDILRLLSVRTSGEEVAAEGLSEGTRDQLYLALRLAAIDLHLENHTPVPLILDDLLMTFDDERTKALLPVLRELSQKTQVLIFTHHEHLIELMGGNALVHRLRA